MKIAYFDCFAGAGGDMIVAAMLDSGLEIEFLKAQLAGLAIEKLDIRVAETKRAGLRALSFEPLAPKQHHHRNLKQITEIITQSKISEKARKTAIDVFGAIAAAEALVHGKSPDEIHFHEVGAVDSIVDVVSASVGLDVLGIEKVYCSTLSIGGGKVKCAHGLIPVPAPATAELIKNIPVCGGPIEAELLTPTAAAILTTITDEFCTLPPMKIETVGCGAGALDREGFPNILRLIVGQAADNSGAEADVVCLLETNIDDISGEVVGYLAEHLLELGALDVFTAPIAMKQNRPAVQLSVICSLQESPRFEQVMFEQGLTFGIRRQILQRSKLAREFMTVETQYGQVRIKVGSLKGTIVNAKPEFADCRQAAQKHNVPLKTVLAAAESAYRRTISESLDKGGSVPDSTP